MSYCREGYPGLSFDLAARKTLRYTATREMLEEDQAMHRARVTIRRLAVLAFAGAALAFTSAASADELWMSGPQAAPADMPARGMTMDTVQSRFGAPSQKLAAVGQPPITRWEYPSYVVYFEYDHVIHSVVKHPLS